MTFSDRRVADVVNRDFVAAWVDRGPGFKNTEFHTERWIFQSDLEAYPTKNICTFFLSPEGKVFYYVAGSYAPEVFLKTLEVAAGLRGALFDAKMKETGFDAAQVHLAKAEAFDALRDDATKAGAGDGWKRLVGAAATYRGLRHQHGPRCATSLAQGYGYFAKLHRSMALWTELPGIARVRTAYLYGNEFSEETADAPRIERLDPDKPLPPPPPPSAATTKSGTILDLGGLDLWK